eukprot:15444830-Alexandrium_andersonii.AAC.1
MELFKWSPDMECRAGRPKSGHLKGGLGATLPVLVRVFPFYEQEPPHGRSRACQTLKGGVALLFQSGDPDPEAKRLIF